MAKCDKKLVTGQELADEKVGRVSEHPEVSLH